VALAGRTVTAFTSAPDGCAFPGRGVGIWEASTSVVTADRRTGRDGDPAPWRGSDPSTGVLTWWSELMHLTSVGGHCSALPGRGDGAHVNTA
jgi:hypothetical protein